LGALHHHLLRILLVVCFVLAVAPGLHAEKRIGVIMTGDISFYRGIHESFVAEMQKRNTGTEKIEIILQRPFPNPISWSNAARKLIAFDVDLIVTYGSPATLAVLHEKSNIPLVYAGLYEPAQTPLKEKNVTGCGFKIPLSSILRYLKRFKTVNTIGIVFSSTEEDSVRQYETMQLLCSQQNIKTEKIDIRSRGDLERMKAVNADAIFMTGSSVAHLWLDEIIAFLDERHIPIADIFPDESKSGVLMTLYQPTHPQGEMTADIASQILLGKKPADVAAHVLRDTELVLNLVEAKHLGIDIPIQLLIEATRVIE
jgi:putative ABC transport system substrate-binding protein